MAALRRTHLLRKKAPTNSNNEGLGLCYTFGKVSSDINQVDCKKCIKRFNEEGQPNG